MASRNFWTRKRKYPGQSAVEATEDTYWMLKLLHPASASAMLLGVFGLGYLGWRLFRDNNLLLAVIAAAVGAFIGAWVGLLLYWLARLIFAFNE